MFTKHARESNENINKNNSVIYRKIFTISK